MNETYDGQLSIKNVGNFVASLAMIFGGVIPYIPQYRIIKRKEDAEGLSLYVCLTLLIANTLRILFWYGKRYETPLLLQSVLMIITMFLMIRLCINVRRRNQIVKVKERVFTDVKHASTDMDTKFFWNWTTFRSYVDFMLLFTVIGGILMYFFAHVPAFVETVGLLAVLTEAMLGVPQFLRNFSNKSTTGMSLAMVFMWLLGDSFKTCYFILREAPIQFQVCGGLQIVIDIAILIQVEYYANYEIASSKRSTISVLYTHEVIHALLYVKL